MTILPRLDRRAVLPLAEQIARHYADSIAGGRLRPGERLPTIRAIADGAGVTRATVQRAYGQLRDRGLVTATVGRGTVVAPSAVHAGPPISPSARAAWRRAGHVRRGLRVRREPLSHLAGALERDPQPRGLPRHGRRRLAADRSADNASHPLRRDPALLRDPGFGRRRGLHAGGRRPLPGRCGGAKHEEAHGDPAARRDPGAQGRHRRDRRGRHRCRRGRHHGRCRRSWGRRRHQL